MGTTLRNQAGGRVGVIGGGNDGAAVFFRQSDNGLGYGGAGADHNTTGLHFNGTILGLIAVCHNDQISLFHNLLHGFRAGGAHDDFTGLDTAVGVAGNQCALQSFQDVLIGGVGAGQKLGVQRIHIGHGQVLQCNDALETPVFIGDGKRGNLLVAHGLPSFPYGHHTRDAGHTADVNILYLCTYVQAQLWDPKTKATKYIVRFTVDIAGAQRLIYTATQLVF